MILVDANLLIYARSTSFSQHQAAKEWLDSTLNSADRVGLPWQSITAFLRILSNPKVVEHSEAIGSLWRQVQSWLAVSGVWIPTPTERHNSCLESLMPSISSSDLVMDAHLAALALEYGLVVYSTDGDFARFRSIRWVNPLAT